MPLWGKSDAASNSTIYAAAQLKVAPNTANRDALFGNTTANAYFDGVTVGQFGVDDNEVAANPGISHTGWVLRTAGSGGRAGRVMTEVLVAGGIGTDASDDVVMPDYIIRVTTQPVNTTINATTNVNNTGVIFTVAATQPTGGSITYLWQANTGSGFVNAAAGTTGNTTANLTVFANTFSTGAQFRALLQVTGAANVTTSVATLTVNT
jgi:hypothetical protein